MRVRIGPYLHWWGSYQLAELLQYVGVSEEKTYEIGIWLSNTWVQDVCEWVYSKRTRTIKVKLDRWDTWGMDSTLAVIILPMLEQLKATKHGAPYVDITDTPWYLSSEFYEKESNGDWTTNQKRWDWVLDEMIWTFNQLIDKADWESRYFRSKEIPFDPLLGGKHEFDSAGLNLHYKAMENGLRLFGKYYMALWD